jgi:hypothetical protein
MAGTASGIAFVLSCGDNLSVKASVDAAVDASRAPDAAPTCDCPAAEPPLTGRFMTISRSWTIAANVNDVETAVCPEGSELITGSCTQDLLNPIRNLILRRSGFYTFGVREWVCLYHNNEPFAVMLRVSVICLKPAP